MPSTTGLTASRWLGLLTSKIRHAVIGSDGCIGQISIVVLDIPGAHQLLAVVAMFELGQNVRTACRMILAWTLSRPRWAIPRITSRPAGAQNALQQGVQQGNDAVAAFQGESGHSHIFFIEKLLEQGGLGEFFKNVPALLGRQIRLVAFRFHARLQPAAFFRILQMHIFHPDGPAIGLLQGL